MGVNASLPGQDKLGSGSDSGSKAFRHHQKVLSDAARSEGPSIPHQHKTVELINWSLWYVVQTNTGFVST